MTAGRPPTYTSQAERAAARKAQNKAAAARYRAKRKKEKPPKKKRQRKEKSFRAYDGEGRMIGDSHRLVLLGTRLDHIANSAGLSTMDCLEFLTRDIRPRGTARIFFAFGYDVAHIVRDLTPDQITRLYHPDENENGVNVGPYNLFYIPRKILRITKNRKRYTYYDVFSFFNMSFIKALKKYLPNESIPQAITEGKAGRAFFGSWDMADIISYHAAECVYLEKLMSTIASLLDETYEGIPKLKPRGWYGPGAVANRLLGGLEVGRMVWPEREYSEKMIDVFSRAYFGGRIEAPQIGTTTETVYRNDIRSAYPYHMANLPLLKWRREWIRSPQFNPDTFGVWRIQWDITGNPADYPLPGPLPWRDDKGKILFRASGDGWYWTPEVSAVVDLFPEYVRIVDGYYMEPPYEYPLKETITLLYEMRAQLKKDGDPREYPVKIALNSGYGKLAQRDGVARYRSLAWAGYITSGCRAQMLRAMMIEPGAVLACLTDGLLTTAQLPLDYGPALGQWEQDKYQGAKIILPGIYQLGTGNGTVKKWRGYNVSHFNFDRVLAVIAKRKKARLMVNMFVSPLLAYHAPDAYGPHMCNFVRRARNITPFNTHKRDYDNRAELLTSELLGSIMPGTMADDLPELSAPYGAFEITTKQQELNNAEGTAVAHGYAISLADFLALIND